MYFPFFKLKKWGKKTAETRRRNCAWCHSARREIPPWLPHFGGAVMAERRD